MATPEQISEGIEPLLKLLVTHPELMVVELIPDNDSFVLRVQVSPQDAGRLIGMQGRTARSLRILLGAIGHQAGVTVKLDIAESN